MTTTPNSTPLLPSPFTPPPPTPSPRLYKALAQELLSATAKRRGGGGLEYGRGRYGTVGGWVELMSSLWFKAEIQEQQEKSVGRRENGVYQEHYSKGPQDTTCSRHAVLTHNTRLALQCYFNLLEEI